MIEYERKIGASKRKTPDHVAREGYDDDVTKTPAKQEASPGQEAQTNADEAVNDAQLDSAAAAAPRKRIRFNSLESPSPSLHSGWSLSPHVATQDLLASPPTTPPQSTSVSQALFTVTSSASGTLNATGSRSLTSFASRHDNVTDMTALTSAAAVTGVADERLQVDGLMASKGRNYTNTSHATVTSRSGELIASTSTSLFNLEGASESSFRSEVTSKPPTAKSQSMTSEDMLALKSLDMCAPPNVALPGVTGAMTSTERPRSIESPLPASGKRMTPPPPLASSPPLPVDPFLRFDSHFRRRFCATPPPNCVAPASNELQAAHAWLARQQQQQQQQQQQRFHPRVSPFTSALFDTNFNLNFNLAATLPPASSAFNLFLPPPAPPTSTWTSSSYFDQPLRPQAFYPANAAFSSHPPVSDVNNPVLTSSQYPESFSNMLPDYQHSLFQASLNQT